MHDLRSVWDCQWKDERLCGAVPAINYCPIEFDFNVTFETHDRTAGIYKQSRMAAGFHSSLKNS